MKTVLVWWLVFTPNATDTIYAEVYYRKQDCLRAIRIINKIDGGSVSSLYSCEAGKAELIDGKWRAVK